MLEAAAPTAAEVLRSIPMVPVSVAHWTLPDAPAGGGERASVPAGFGFLVPRVAGVRLLGTLFPSQLFSGRAPGGHQLFASYFGGATDGAAMGLSDEALTGLLLDEHRPIFGEVGEARVLRVLRHAAAIPQLLPDHPERIGAIREALEAIPGLELAGNYLTGVGIEAAVESGYSAAARCREALEARCAQRGAA
jgi:oxygen-dependent protoporphyrinogen oxidase